MDRDLDLTNMRSLYILYIKIVRSGSKELVGDVSDRYSVSLAKVLARLSFHIRTD